jgi:glutamate 5-kinase
MMKKKTLTIVVRIEISTLINRNGIMNRRKMDRLAMGLTNLNNSGMHVLVVSSGAIILGAEKLKLRELPKIQLDMQATASVGQTELIRWYEDFFDTYNQIVAQVLLTSDIVDYPLLVENTRNTFKTLLDMGIIPIINENDPVSTADIEIDDNYPLALLVAGIVKADFIVIKLESDGKYLIVPNSKEKAIVAGDETELQNKLESMQHLGGKEIINEKMSFPVSIDAIVY